MTIEAKVISDSISEEGYRLTTFQVKYQRFIHSELMTHRHFCIGGDTLLDFEASHDRHNVKRETIRDFVEKWHKGTKEHITPHHNGLSLNSIKDDKIYTAQELKFVLDMVSTSSLTDACRKNKVENAYKDDRKGWSALGKDWKEWRSTTGLRRLPVKNKLSEKRIRQYNEKTGEIISSTVKDCVFSGIKRVYKVTADKFEVVATEEHKFLTGQGWKKLKDIEIFDTLLTYKYGENIALGNRSSTEENMQWHWNKKIKPALASKQEYKCWLTNNILLEKFDVHHIKPCFSHPQLAFDITNVVAVNSEAHREHHKTGGHRKGVPLKVKESPIKEIKYIGEMDTYDLEINGEFENYFANGIVVHNSRNASSSRAIPVSKALKSISNDPATPVHFGLNQAGMKANAEVDQEVREEALALWYEACDSACYYAKKMAKLGVHKQITNRLTEPFAHINVVITATQMSNFYALRRHPDAQPEIKVLADAMWEAQEASTPQLLKPGQWHLPYIQPHEWCDYNDEDSGTEILKKVSAARCARVSYMTFDGEPSILEKDIELCRKLIGADILHASPFEHQATPDRLVNKYKGILRWVKYGWANPDLHGNFTGWCQNRKFMDGECQ